MRFAACRQAYMTAQRHFGSEYRRGLPSLTRLNALGPYRTLTTQRNAFTLRIEPSTTCSLSAALGIAALRHGLVPPTSEFGGLESSGLSEWLLSLLEEYQCKLWKRGTVINIIDRYS
mmetsp:Transcript_9300/g.22820  ORF Transcript_9300/g.22820 Transcript_9300/m.22820 type:complete len:117 (-) Transcript_9300:506-856(-)